METAVVRFVGGPLDGQLQEMPVPLPSIYVLKRFDKTNPEEWAIYDERYLLGGSEYIYQG